MAVPVQTPLNSSLANGVTTVFPYGFLIFKAADLSVTVNGVAQTLGVHYTVSGVGNATGGNVTFTAAPANGATVVRRRRMAYSRDTDYQFQGDFLASEVNPDQDAPVMMIQQLALDQQLAIKIPESQLGILNPTLPSPVGLQVFRYNGAGTAIETYVPGPVSAPDGANQVGFTQAGAGAIPRSVEQKLSDMRSVKDFGAVGDGVTNDTVAIQKALNSGAGTVFLPKGTYFISAQLTVPADTVLEGQGTQSLILPAAALGSMVRLIGNSAIVRGCHFFNAGGLATSAVTIGSDFCTVERNYFSNMKRCVQIDSAQALRIVQNTMIGQDFGVFIIDDGRNSVIENCHIQGGTCVWVGKISIQNEGLRVSNCFLAPSTTADANSGHGIVINGGLELTITNNIIDNIDKYGLFITGASNTEAVKVIGNWFGADAAVPGSGGIFTAGPIKQIQVIGNTITGSNGFGMNVDFVSGGPPNAFDISHNRFFDNLAGDLRIDSLLFSTISNNQFNSSSISTIEQDNTSACDFFGNVYTIAPTVRSTGSRYRDNSGFRTEASGDASIASGSTSVVVTHGLGVTPAAKDISLIGRFNPTNDPGLLYVDTFNATTFTVRCRFDPGASGFFFSWRAVVL